MTVLRNRLRSPRLHISFLNSASDRNADVYYRRIKLKTLHPLPSRYQVAVVLVVSIVTGLLAGVALPLGFYGNWTWAVSLTFIAVVSAVICWHPCPEEHWLQLRATLIMAALPIAGSVYIIHSMQGMH